MTVPVRRTIQPRRRTRPNYWLRRLVVLLILLMPVSAWKAWSFYSHLPVKAEGTAPRLVPDKPVYVAVMGVDERENDVGRSDTLMLLRLDSNLNTVSVINIPRDTRVTHLDGDHTKINAAYAAKGPDYVTEVVADLLSIPKPYYVTINFKSFEELVDLVDGVSIDVEKHYVYDDPFQDLHIDIPAGRQHMYGEMALHYVRLRYDGVTNSDIARIERQQKFLQAFKEKLPANWSKVPSMIQTLRQYVKTNVPESDQLKLLKALFDARNNLTMKTLPGTPDDATGDWLLDPVQWSEVKQSWQSAL